ncbi:hypothetical protein Tco_1256471 [Tanacetum coccineum]
MSEFKQTNQFAEAVSSIPAIVDNYLASKLKDAVDAIIKEQVKAQVSKIMSKVEKYVTESMGYEVLNYMSNLVDDILLRKCLYIKDCGRLKMALIPHDEEPSTGSNRGSKRRRSGKEAESSKEPPHKESKSTSSSKGVSKSQPKSSGTSTQAEGHGPRVDDLEEQSHQEFNSGNDDVLTAREVQDVDERQWNPSSSPTPDHEWHKTKTFLATPIDFSTFIMNRLKIENLTQDVLIEPTYDLMKVTSLKIMQLFGYSHLEEIKVQIQDDQLYKFREGNFKKLHRQDIEDMLLLLTYYHSRTYGRSTTGSRKLPEEVNLSRPDAYHSDLRRMTPYTAYPDIHGIIYQDDIDRNCLMRTDELHKFNDDTLNHVCTALNDIATRIQMEYLPKRKSSKQDKQRARVMINAIDKKLRDRRLMRSLEKFIGGRPYGGDLRLLGRTI